MLPRFGPSRRRPKSAARRSLKSNTSPTLGPAFELLEDRTVPVGPLPDYALNFGGLTAPNLPAGVDIFTPTVVSPTALPAAPDFAEWTRTAAGDQSIAISGEEFTQLTGNSAGLDTSFWVWSQTNTSNGQLLKAQLQHLEGTSRAMITIPSGIATNSMLLLWAENGQGVGLPVAVNQAETWWIGPDMAQAGQSIAIHGRNLSRTGGEWTTGDSGAAPAYVWVEPVAGGAGQWASVTDVNSYRVKFVVPAGLGNGAYRAWLHNGRGGEYGWAQPLEFTVRSAAANGTSWTGPVFDAGQVWVVNGQPVQMTPNDTTDDFLPLQAALDAASYYNVTNTNGPYPTVFIPTGTFLIGQSLTIPSNVRITGAGATSTVLKAIATAFTTPILRGNIYSNNIDVRDLTLHSGYNNLAPTDNLYTGGLSVLARFDNRVDVRLTNIIFEARSGTALAAYGVQRLYVTNCDFYSNANFLDQSRQVFVDNCNFYETNNSGYAILNWGGQALSLTHSFATGLNWADPTKDAGWGLRLFSNGRGGRFQYVAHNTTQNLGNRPGINMNVGEHLLWEGGAAYFTDTPDAFSPVTITFTGLESLDLDAGYDYYAVVLDGRGAGQSRRIVAFNSEFSIVTLESPWAVLIAGTSRIGIQYLVEDIAVYDNDLEGIAENVSRTTYNGSAGIMLFGGVLNVVVDRNTLTNFRRPISLWSVSSDVEQAFLRDLTSPLDMVEPAFFNLVTGNTIDYGRDGILVFTSSGNAIADNVPVVDFVPLIGNVIRGNVLTNMLSAGLGVAYHRSFDDWRSHHFVDTVIFESNSVTNTPTGFNFDIGYTSGEYPAATGGAAVQNALVRNNYFSLGTATYAGSRGIHLGANQAPLLQNNTFAVFQTTYSGIPLLSVSIVAGPTAGDRTYAFIFSATDVLVGGDSFMFEIDWTNDGAYDQVTGFQGGRLFTAKTYSVAEAATPVTVRVRVSTPGGFSVVRDLTINVNGRGIAFLGSDRADDIQFVESSPGTVLVNVLTVGDRTLLSSRTFTQVLGGSSLVGGSGPDRLSAAALTSVAAVLTGNAGSDTLQGGNANDVLDGGDGPDTLEGGVGNDSLYGGLHRDTLRGGAGNDTLVGYYGDDEYQYFSTILDSGTDVIQEVATVDSDWLNFAYLDRPVTVTATSIVVKNIDNQTVISVGIADSTSIEGILGTSFADSISANGRRNQILGRNGADSLFGLDGDDTIDGGEGYDSLDAGAGADWIDGGEGGDTILGQAGNDIIDGGEGSDLMDGGEGEDSLDGGTYADTIQGGLGNDTLIGGRGNDSLIGGNGNDVYQFSRSSTSDDIGSDVVVEAVLAADALDALDFTGYSAGVSGVVANLSDANGVVLDAPGKLKILAKTSESGSESADGFEGLSGTEFADVMTGTTGNDLLLGGAGNDTLIGLDGRDILVGGSGSDTLSGDAGEDILMAGMSTYTLLSHLTPLASIKAEWESPALQALRILNLTGSGLGGLNGTNYLNAATLIDDVFSDTVTGGADADWLHFDFLQDLLGEIDLLDILASI